MDEQITIGEPEASIRAVLYSRKELPPPAASRITSVEHRLESLGEEANIEFVGTRTWCNRAPLHHCERSVRELFTEFSLWAESTGRSLTPFFSVRECYSTGETNREDWVVLPTLCLAVYEGERLRAVYPHRTESSSFTVDDGLGLLENERRLLATVGRPSDSDVSVIRAN